MESDRSGLFADGACSFYASLNARRKNIQKLSKSFGEINGLLGFCGRHMRLVCVSMSRSV